jgi:2-polyprenyl-3-methyl-5-hydroxy-6-metoxy-1,4-benzoquinol methylase
MNIREHAGYRNCVNCDADDSEIMFTFTKKWLVEVRSTPSEILDRMNIDDNFSSSIVKCKNCGCGYIKDVIESREPNSEWSQEKIKENIEFYQKLFSRETINHLQYEYSLIKNLLDLVLQKKKDNSELSLLDFGSSLSILSPMSRVMGFSDVMAYDPLYPNNISEITPQNTAINFKFVTDIEEVKAKAPFDAIICQSADEHFYDLKGDIKNIYDLLSDDGVAYFSHPVMDLDGDIGHLRNEANVKDKKTISRLRATFHVHHLNYVMPKMFKDILIRTGFKEIKVVMLKQRVAGVNFFNFSNLKLFFKSFAKYFLGLLGSNYRKTEFFLEKYK